MDVGMMDQRLSPGVQNRQDANLSAKVSGLGRDFLQRLGTSPEQDLVEPFLILQGNGRQFMRHCEHDMKVMNGEQFRSPLLHPRRPCKISAFWAVPVAARVVDLFSMSAMFAFLQVAAEFGRAAVANGGYHAGLLTIAAVNGVPPEYVRQL